LVDGTKKYWYKSFIGKEFNYLGSEFNRESYLDGEAFLSSLGASSLELKNLLLELDVLVSKLADLGINNYNVDLFTFKNSKGKKSFAVSEINFRKTMGHLFSKIFEMYFADCTQCSFQLSREQIQGKLYLSPKQAPFQIEVQMN
jgi:hypothetical protein